MPSYKSLYLYLQREIAEALRELEQEQSAAAENRLKEAQSACEEMLLAFLDKS